MTRAQKDFFFQPITRYVGDRTADLRGAELASFITQLHNHVTENSLDKTQNSNFFYWLTYALYCAVKSSDTAAIEILSAVTIKILNQDAASLEAMFQQSTSGGAFQGQSFFYVWMNNYCSLVYSEAKDFSSLLALDLVFKKLLDASSFKFCSMLVKENEGKGMEEGKNPLLALLRALLQSVTLVNNRVETALIAELFQNCMHAEPEIMGEALPNEFTRSLFKGKSNLYVLFSALLKAGRHDSNLVTVIQEALLQVLDTNPQPFLHELYKINALGPYKGLSSLHLILLTLVEAAYIKDNSAVLAQLMTIISRLDSYHIKEEYGKSDLMLLAPINTGEYSGLNGMMFLTRALIAGSEHGLDVVPIANQIEQLIKSATPAKLASALSQNNPENVVPEYTISPLAQLVKQVELNESTAIPPYLMNIFKSIPISLLPQLSTTLPQAFADKLNKVYERIAKENPVANAKGKEHDNSHAGDVLFAQYTESQTFFKKHNKVDEPTTKPPYSSPPKRQV